MTRCIKINLLKHEREHDHILARFLYAMLQKHEHYIMQDEAYAFYDEAFGDVQLRFSHSLLYQIDSAFYRQTNFEIHDRQSVIGKGSQGTVCEVQGILQLTTGRISIIPSHQARVIKLYLATENPYIEAEVSMRLIHLEAKPLVRIHHIEGGVSGFALSMKRFRGVPLRAYLETLSTEGASAFQTRIHLILAFLRAYQAQVLSAGLIHRDIKPENMLVANNPLEVNIIDYANAASLSAEVLGNALTSPLIPDGECEVDETALIGMLPVTDQFLQHQEQQIRRDKLHHRDSFPGTIGYIPPEAYDPITPLTPQYDCVAIARTIAVILGYAYIKKKIQNYDEAKEESRALNYEGKLSSQFIGNERIKHDIETWLNRLVSPDPRARTNVLNVQHYFESLIEVRALTETPTQTECTGIQQCMTSLSACLSTTLFGRFKSPQTQNTMTTMQPVGANML